MILVLDSARQQMFSWQSGADEIVLRPYRAEELLRLVASAIERPDNERPAHRRQKIDEIRAQSANPVEAAESPVGAARFN